MQLFLIKHIRYNNDLLNKNVRSLPNYIVV